MRLQLKGRNSGLVGCLIVAMLLAPLWGSVWAAPFDLGVTVSLAEHPVINRSESFSNDMVSEIPRLHVLDTVTTSLGFTQTAAADSAPFFARAATSSTGSIANASANFLNEISFTDNQALRNLIPAGNSSLSLLVHFHAVLETIAPDL